MQVTLNLIVDTDLESVDDIMDSIDIEATPNDENVEVYDCEVVNYCITDSK
jgi:hypothetical protein